MNKITISMLLLIIILASGCLYDPEPTQQSEHETVNTEMFVITTPTLSGGVQHTKIYRFNDTKTGLTCYFEPGTKSTSLTCANTRISNEMLYKEGFVTGFNEGYYLSHEDEYNRRLVGYNV